MLCCVVLFDCWTRQHLCIRSPCRYVRKTVGGLKRAWTVQCHYLFINGSRWRHVASFSSAIDVPSIKAALRPVSCTRSGTTVRSQLGSQQPLARICFIFSSSLNLQDFRQSECVICCHNAISGWKSASLFRPSFISGFSLQAIHCTFVYMSHRLCIGSYFVNIYILRDRILYCFVQRRALECSSYFSSGYGIISYTHCDPCTGNPTRVQCEN